MTELTLVFCNFGNAPKKECVSIAHSRENYTPKAAQDTGELLENKHLKN